MIDRPWNLAIIRLIPEIFLEAAKESVAFGIDIGVLFTAPDVTASLAQHITMIALAVRALTDTQIILKSLVNMSNVRDKLIWID